MHNGHLSIEEIESLSQQESQSLRQQNLDDWAHVENCDRCRNLVEKCRAFDSKLAKLASAHLRPESDMNCPDQNIWFEVAAGALPDEKSLQYLEHTATCAECGKKLRTAINIFDDSSVSAQDLSLLLEAPNPYPASSSRRIKKKPQTTFNVFFPGRRILAYSLFITGLLFLGAVSWPTLREKYGMHQASKIIATAYEQGRPMIYRPAEVPYGPAGGERGIEGENERQLRAATPIPNPAKVPWLVANASFLQNDYESVIALLEPLSELNTVPAWIFDDLAVSYAMKADGISAYAPSQAAIYYKNALVFTERSIHADPNDRVAYFNRALIKHRLDQNFHEDLQQFLKLEPDSRWREQVQKLLQ